MVFSSPIFFFGFLPIALLLYYASPRAIRNSMLLAISLFFYAWGEVFYIGVMLASIGFNYAVGRWLARTQDSSDAGTERYPSYVLALGIAFNLLLLGSFKYANFVADNINVLLAQFGVGPLELAPVHLPLGISFFTFQAISYLVDVYRKEVAAQKNLVDLALFISLFPQLVAGPIVRYHDVATQILERRHSTALFAEGVQRFVFGLARKLLIANPLGEVADSIFLLSGDDLTMPLAWIGVLCFTLQIYFDFSGYSDMAIGLGKMFGFRFRENFNYPYVARTLREFWKRWHISLSSWFRDYVYIPLGGNRVRPVRVYFNLFVVFLLTGIWHGASWNFVVWGLFHGVFLASEHMGFSRVLERAWRPLQHLYLLLVVVFSWVFFKAETLTEALHYCAAMLDLERWSTTRFQYEQVISEGFYYAFPLGCILAAPLYPWVRDKVVAWASGVEMRALWVLAVPRLIAVAGLLFICAVDMAASTYNPFIYFRF